MNFISGLTNAVVDQLGFSNEKTLKKRFTKHEKIGSGASGVVYRCTDNKTGVDYAYKEMKIVPGTPKTYLINEYKIVESLNQTDPKTKKNVLKGKNVLQYVSGAEATNDNGEKVVIFIANLIKGNDLERIIYSDIVLKTEEIKWLMAQLLVGLQTLSDASVVHFDIKPSNIMITNDFKLEIIDFGTAWEIGQKAGKNKLIGTFNYYNEKMLKINDNGSKGEVTSDLVHYDLWCAGCVLYELWNRNFLFKSIPSIKDDHKKKLNEFDKVVMKGDKNIFAKDKENPTDEEKEVFEFFKVLMTENMVVRDPTVVSHPWIKNYLLVAAE